MPNQQYYSFLLSQIVGVFFFLIAIIVMGRMYYYRKLVLQIKIEDASIPIGACCILFLGIVMVLTHNLWGFRHVTVLTLLGWIILITGVLWLVIPEKMLALTKQAFSGTGYYWMIIWFLVIGIGLLSRGMELFILHHGDPNYLLH